jgi:Peptidase inhibitor family I36
MTKMNRLFIVGLLMAAGMACGDENPSTPSGISVEIYQNSDYGGDSRIMTTSVADLDDLPGCGGASADWDDCISSIRIPSPWEITVFEDDNYAGSSMTFTADVPDLERIPGPCGNDWDDCISSIQVRRR